MTPAYATGLNCYQACVASILDMEMHQVPDFVYAYGDDFVKRTDEWLYEKGYVLLHFACLDKHVSKSTTCAIQTPYQGCARESFILVGELPEGVGHAVVANKNGVIHDPTFHPSLWSSNPYGFLKPIPPTDKLTEPFWEFHIILRALPRSA